MASSAASNINYDNLSVSSASLANYYNTSTTSSYSGSSNHFYEPISSGSSAGQAANQNAAANLPPASQVSC